MVSSERRPFRTKQNLNIITSPYIIGDSQTLFSSHVADRSSSFSYKRDKARAGPIHRTIHKRFLFTFLEEIPPSVVRFLRIVLFCGRRMSCIGVVGGLETLGFSFFYVSTSRAQGVSLL